jgi:hypothetical protein
MAGSFRTDYLNVSAILSLQEKELSGNSVAAFLSV